MNMLYGFWHGMIVHLWQTTLILALLLVIERALRGAPSRVSHTLWGIGLLKIFLPLSFFGGVAGALYRAAGGGPQTFDRAGGLVLQPIVTVLFPIANGGAPVLGSTLSYAIVAATAAWAAFVLYFIARLIIDAVRVRRQSGVPLAALEPALARRLGGVLDGAAIPRESVLVSGDFVMPTVAGLLRPRIVIPEGLVRELPEEQLRAIVLHEDAHRRRRDPLRAAAHRLGLAIFFFYPLIYPVLRRLQSTAEYACDESVVHSGVAAEDYSRALARTLELGLAAPAFAAAAAAGGSLLRRRLRRLPTLNSRRYAMRLKYRLLLSVAALIVAAATFYPVPMRAGSSQEPDSSAVVQQPDTAGIVNAFDEAPVLMKKAAPVYPEKAKKLGVQAMVRLSLVIDENGKVTDATIVPADAEGTAGAAPDTELEGEALSKLDKPQLKELRASFEKSAREAAMKWEFKAASLKGEPVKTRVAVPVRFRLN